MTDLSHQAFGASTSSRAADRRPWPLWPWVCVFAAGTAGLMAGHAMADGSFAYEAKLALLLRFMAAMKLVGVLLAAGLTHWRLRSPIARPLAAAYLCALAVMALAPGLIWSLGGIAPGALLFHVGLLAFLVLAWKDEGVGLPRRPRRRA